MTITMISAKMPARSAPSERPTHHQGIAPGDRPAAVAAAAAQPEEAEDGDVVARPYGVAAVRAAGARRHQRLLARQAVNGHVGKTAGHRAKQRRHNGLSHRPTPPHGRENRVPRGYHLEYRAP